MRWELAPWWVIFSVLFFQISFGSVGYRLFKVPVFFFFSLLYADDVYVHTHTACVHGCGLRKWRGKQNKLSSDMWSLLHREADCLSEFLACTHSLDSQPAFLTLHEDCSSRVGIPTRQDPTFLASSTSLILYTPHGPWWVLSKIFLRNEWVSSWTCKLSVCWSYLGTILMLKSISRESLDKSSFLFIMHGIKYREMRRIQNLKLENLALILLLAVCVSFRKLA